VSRHPQLELMRYAIRPYIFTASLAPSVIASTRVALGILQHRRELRQRLWENVEQLYGTLQRAGFRLGPHPGPVIAVEVEEKSRALAWWKELMERGVYVNLVLPPATPTGSCLLRCSLSAAHSREQIERIETAFLSLPEAPAGAI
jgi:8-amino-7-oxononanoate synthase